MWGSRRVRDIGTPMLARQRTRRRRDTLCVCVSASVCGGAHTQRCALRKSAHVLVSSLNAWNHLALIFFSSIFIFIFNCFSACFLLMLHCYSLCLIMQSLLFLLLFCRSLLTLPSRCVHVWMQAHTHTQAHKKHTHVCLSAYLFGLQLHHFANL